MPDWVVLLLLAVVSWLTVAVGGGLLFGRLLDAFSRMGLLHRRRPR
jgi:hypothetical protein